MGFLLSYIFLALLFCFFIGLLLGLLWWWFRRQGESAEYQRQLLEAEAEGDRLRLRVSSLKSAESRADKLAAELETNRSKLARIPELESQADTFRAGAALVPGLEKQISTLQEEADKVGSLETRISALSKQAARVPDLEAEIERLNAEVERTSSLDAELVSLQGIAGRGPDLETKISELEQEAARAGELEVSVGSFVGGVGVGAGGGGSAGELEVSVGSLSAELESVRAEAATAGEAGASVESLQGANVTLEQRLAERDATIEGLRSDLAMVNAEAGRVSSLEAELQGLRGQSSRVVELEAELDQARAETEQSAAMQADLAAARSEAEAAQAVASRLQARIDQLESALDGGTDMDRELTELRTRLEAAEAAAELVPERDATIAELRLRLGEAEEAQAAAAASGPSDPQERPSWQKGTTKLGTPGADHIDDLKKIHGIGPVMEKTLQSFGIQTWEQVAAFTAADIEKVTAAIDAFPGRIERDDWMGGAQALLDAGHVPGDASPDPSESDNSEGPSWQAGTTTLGTPGAAHTDDLKVINGIGPVMEKTLRSFGIKTWEQLAAFRDTDVATVTDAIDAFPGRIERDEWVRQARDLVERFPLRSPYDRPTRETFLNESAGG